MAVPRRIREQEGRHATVDGIPFVLPINSEKSPALMAAFTVDAEKAARLMPAGQLHPLRLPGGRGILLITVIDYRITDIGKYIEFSIALACTRGRSPAPPLLPLVFQKASGLGQFVLDLPVSTEISVKGGKGIWGMPKHQASLDFLISDDTVSSQYDLDDMMVMRIEIDRPAKAWLPVRMSAVNYCQFRGMLMKSYIYVTAKAGFTLFNPNAARLSIGDHPRAGPLKELDINPAPLFTAFMPESDGVLDDHVESWFLSYDEDGGGTSEGLESVVQLGLGQEWPSPPDRDRGAPSPSAEPATP